MGKIRKIGTVLICMILLLGCCTVLATMGSYFLKHRGVNNAIVDWYTQNASVSLDWLKGAESIPGKYARETSLSDRYREIITGIEDTVESFCTESWPCNGEIHELVTRYKKNIMHYSLSTEIGGDTDTKMVKSAVENIDSFYSWLQSRGIDFLYVNLPSGIRINMANGTSDWQQDNLEAYDKFDKEMRDSKIPYINLSSNIWDITDCSLDVSGHWMPKDALKATSVIAGRMNELGICTFDLSIFDESNYSNAMVLNQDAARAIQEDYGYDYQLWTPNNGMAYTVTVNEATEYTGDFVDTLLKESSVWDTRYSGNAAPYHDVWRINNGSFYDIVNNGQTNNDIKILVIGDSYSWLITSYLAQDVKQISTMHPKHFYGSVRKYIEITQPDLVLWMYQEGQCVVDVDKSYGVVNQ